jgi:hypothetical protein
LTEGDFKGFSILPNGDLYILSSSGTFRIEDFKEKIDAGETIEAIKIGDYNEEKHKVIQGVTGTILNAVSVPLDTVDDFDIDDKTMINRLLLYYSTHRFMYYWYIPEIITASP